MRRIDRAESDAFRRVVDDLFEKDLDRGRQPAFGTFRYIGIDVRVRDEAVHEDLHQHAAHKAYRHGYYPAPAVLRETCYGGFDHAPYRDGEHDARAQADQHRMEPAGKIAPRGIDDGSACKRSRQRDEHAEESLRIRQRVRTVEVRDERAQTDEDEYRTAHYLGARPVPAPENTSYLHACGRDQEGNNAYHGDGQKDIGKTPRRDDFYRNRDKGYTHGKRVDAGRDRHHEHGLDIEPGGGFLVGGERFLDHVAADYGEQHESNPRRHHVDELLEERTYQITDKRHRTLEETEPRTADEKLFAGDLLRGQTFADGYGKGIHGQTY